MKINETDNLANTREHFWTLLDGRKGLTYSTTLYMFVPSLLCPPSQPPHLFTKGRDLVNSLAHFLQLSACSKPTTTIAE